MLQARCTWRSCIAVIDGSGRALLACSCWHGHCAGALPSGVFLAVLRCAPSGVHLPPRLRGGLDQLLRRRLAREAGGALSTESRALILDGLYLLCAIFGTARRPRGIVALLRILFIHRIARFGNVYSVAFRWSWPVCRLRWWRFTRRMRPCSSRPSSRRLSVRRDIVRPLLPLIRSRSTRCVTITHRFSRCAARLSSASQVAWHGPFFGASFKGRRQAQR